MLRQGLLLGKGFGLAHRTFGDFDIAAASGCDGAHQGCSVVFHLLFHHVVQVAAAERDGMGRAGIGAGGHGGDVGGFEDKKSGGRSAAAAGRDVKNDRNLRAGNFLDDLARRFNEASGSIDLDQYSLIVATAGLVDGASNVFLGNGLNRVVDDDLQDFARSGAAEREEGCQHELKSLAKLKCDA